VEISLEEKKSGKAHHQLVISGNFTRGKEKWKGTSSIEEAIQIWIDERSSFITYVFFINFYWPNHLNI
jgi:hypothetical protein